MNWLIVTLKVQDGRREEFEAVLKGLTDKVHANEPDAPVYVLTRNQADASEYVIVEAYATDEALAAHMQTPYFLEAAPKFRACLAADPVVQRTKSVFK